MEKTKKTLMVSAVVVVVVSVVLLAIPFIGIAQNQPNRQDITTTPIVREVTSSPFGKKVEFPNSYEGKVWTAWLESYPLGQNKAEYRNYDDFLDKVEVAQRIKAIVDPALAALWNKVPNAQVDKRVFNGFTTVYVKTHEPYRERFITQDYPVYALSFDLRTGEKIDLRSVFADNFDAQTAVDRAVQSYVLAYDEENMYRFKGVDLGKTQFVPDLKGIWLIFNDNSLFLSGKSIYLEWYWFGDGAVALFDRFVQLDASEIASGDDVPSYYGSLLYRSEPRYLAAQNTNFFLPINYENDYEKELAVKAKQVALANLDLRQTKVPEGTFIFERIGDYRYIDVRCQGGVWNESKQQREYPTDSLIGIFNIKEKREITMAEYFGDDYAQRLLAQFHEKVANAKNCRALVTDQEFLDLAKTAKSNFVDGTVSFARNIYANEYTDNVVKYNALQLKPQEEWWR